MNSRNQNNMPRELATIERDLAIGNIETYIQWAQQIPVLSASEELELTTRLSEEQDIDAARKLVLHHLRFVIHVAKGYLGYGLPVADLIQEGNIGLMKAIKKFNPKEGVRLISYAIHWIKAEIHEYVLKNVSIVANIASTKAKKKLFYNLKEIKRSLTQKKSLTKSEIAQVAKQLNVSEQEVITMEQRLEYGNDISFDTPQLSYDEQAAAPEDYLEDTESNQAIMLEHSDWKSLQQKQLMKALDGLDPRERTILELRWLSEEKHTLQALAKKLSVSTERIRQLEKKAMEHIKRVLEATQ